VTLDISGAAGLAALNEKSSPDAAPPTVVTVTATFLAVKAGVIAVIFVEEFTMNERAATPPKDTPVTSVKSVPVITTLEPPSVEPEFGLNEETFGAFAFVKAEALEINPPRD